MLVAHDQVIDLADLRDDRLRGHVIAGDRARHDEIGTVHLRVPEVGDSPRPAEVRHEERAVVAECLVVVGRCE
jgi:hypothetical protein